MKITDIKKITEKSSAEKENKIKKLKPKLINKEIKRVYKDALKDIKKTAKKGANCTSVYNCYFKHEEAIDSVIIMIRKLGFEVIQYEYRFDIKW